MLNQCFCCRQLVTWWTQIHMPTGRWAKSMWIIQHLWYFCSISSSYEVWTLLTNRGRNILCNYTHISGGISCLCSSLTLSCWIHIFCIHTRFEDLDCQSHHVPFGTIGWTCSWLLATFNQIVGEVLYEIWHHKASITWRVIPQSNIFALCAANWHNVSTLVMALALCVRGGEISVCTHSQPIECSS